jgi:hypothetical protein
MAVDSTGKPKSLPLAIVLAAVLGPIGLAYSSITGAVVIILAALPFFLTQTGGIWLTIVGRLVCVVWAVYALSKKEMGGSTTAADEAQNLLNEAARTERTDPKRAESLYREIIDRFSGTDQARDAAKDLEALLKPRSGMGGKSA